jgi:hypothetical protein
VLSNKPAAPTPQHTGLQLHLRHKQTQDGHTPTPTNARAMLPSCRQPQQVHPSHTMHTPPQGWAQRPHTRYIHPHTTHPVLRNQPHDDQGHPRATNSRSTPRGHIQRAWICDSNTTAVLSSVALVRQKECGAHLSTAGTMTHLLSMTRNMPHNTCHNTGGGMTAALLQTTCQ